MTKWYLPQMSLEEKTLLGTLKTQEEELIGAMHTETSEAWKALVKEFLMSQGEKNCILERAPIYYAPSDHIGVNIVSMKRVTTWDGSNEFGGDPVTL